jgi:carboxyl-terminal processing protease
MLLEGDPGTTVEVGILRYSRPEPTKMTLTRAVVQDPPVTAKMLPDQIGLIEATSLENGRIRDVRAKLEDLQKQGAKRIILDLRNNPLGDPEHGVQLADLFLDKGLITYAEGQKHPRREFQAVASNTVSKLPLVVVTNRGTAGPAEVAAAALLENKRAEVVGERTYGKAGIRKPITMEDGSAVILSVAKYYSPNGKAIQDSGVTPSVAVIDQRVTDVEDEEEAQPDSDIPPSAPKGEDVILKKAIEVALKGPSAVASETKPANNEGGADRRATPLGIPVPPPR